MGVDAEKRTYRVWCLIANPRNLPKEIVDQELALRFKLFLEKKDGETIDGVADGQMSREIQWKCQYEDALIQPPRGVVDIHMGNYASGKR